MSIKYDPRSKILISRKIEQLKENLFNRCAGQITVVPVSGVTINSTPGLKVRTQWSAATLLKRAENTWVLIGDLAA